MRNFNNVLFMTTENDAVLCGAHLRAVGAAVLLEVAPEVARDVEEFSGFAPECEVCGKQVAQDEQRTA